MSVTFSKLMQEYHETFVEFKELEKGLCDLTDFSSPWTMKDMVSEPCLSSNHEHWKKDKRKVVKIILVEYEIVFNRLRHLSKLCYIQEVKE